MTSVMPPAYVAVKKLTPLFQGMGATKVEATDSTTLKVSFDNNSNAVNATAAFNDTVMGAKLVVANHSQTPDAPQVSWNGVKTLVGGIQGATVQIATPPCGARSGALMIGHADKLVVDGLNQVLRSRIEVPNEGPLSVKAYVIPTPVPPPPPSAAG